MLNKHANTKSSHRVPMWLPYLQAIEETRGGIFNFVFKGGNESTKLDFISSIMIYGGSDIKLDAEVIEKIVRKGIPIIIHRRNMAMPIYITGGLRPDPDDTVSSQIQARLQSRKTVNITRQILKAKFKSMKWLIDPAPLPKFATVKSLRNIESVHAKRYWEKYFNKLGHPEWTRRGNNPASEALDASSKFISGIILRWILYHHMSPYHGYLHETTDYPALVYDLMEPYRGIFEQVLLERWVTDKVFPEKYLVSAIATLKEFLDEQTYIPLTRQIVTNQEMLHGVVLSLKYYVLGRQRKFLIPMPGKPNGGRPPKVNFLLYGRHAGKTDFWDCARNTSQRNFRQN